jgi:hypothetical protein
MNVPDPDFNTCSYICFTCIGIFKKLEVCKSAAGYYIGVPGMSRDSVEYYRDIYEARAALSCCSWTQRLRP